MSLYLHSRLDRMAAVAVTMALLSGCTALAGRPASPLTIKHEEPTIVLCMSQRTSDGGLRLIGKLDPGIHPVMRATLEWRTAAPEDAPPTIAGAGGRLVLATPRSEKVTYRKGANEVAYEVGGDGARSLRGKVLWYRWILEYTSGGSAYNTVTDVHRTSLEEAGQPRSAGTPGPDSSVAPATTRRR
jgi:hypothetical protein